MSRRDKLHTLHVHKLIRDFNPNFMTKLHIMHCLGSVIASEMSDVPGDTSEASILPTKQTRPHYTTTLSSQMPVVQSSVQESVENINSPSTVLSMPTSVILTEETAPSQEQGQVSLTQETQQQVCTGND